MSSIMAEPSSQHFASGKNNFMYEKFGLQHDSKVQIDTLSCMEIILLSIL